MRIIENNSRKKTVNVIENIGNKHLKTEIQKTNTRLPVSMNCKNQLNFIFYIFFIYSNKLIVIVLQYENTMIQQTKECV